MIVSGGVNIYPQEVEDHLLLHPKVTDAAVFGVPDAGSRGTGEGGGPGHAAGWRPAPSSRPSCWRTAVAGLAHYKCPRSIDFEAELPRGDNGKLYKRVLRDRYWAGHVTRLL